MIVSIRSVRKFKPSIERDSNVFFLKMFFKMASFMGIFSFTHFNKSLSGSRMYQFLLVTFLAISGVFVGIKRIIYDWSYFRVVGSILSVSEVMVLFCFFSSLIVMNIRQPYYFLKRSSFSTKNILGLLGRSLNKNHYVCLNC